MIITSSMIETVNGKKYMEFNELSELVSKLNCYMVRARNNDILKFFIDNNIVAVGWSDVDFTKFKSSSSLRNEVNIDYYEGSKYWGPYIGKRLNEVERFKNIKKGDLILIPSWSGVYLAIADDKEIYYPSPSPLYKCDSSNARSVIYEKNYDNKLKIIDRINLTEGLQRRLRVRGTCVGNLNDFKDEIVSLFYHGSNYKSDWQQQKEECITQIKKQLLDNIQNGKTRLQAGGQGLEALIQIILENYGFNAKILPKNTFKSGVDADIEAIKTDILGANKILIQVKHHTAISGSEGIQQLIPFSNIQGYENHSRIFITSASSVTQEVTDLASKNNIRVITGEELVNLIVNNLDELSDDIMASLGICLLPVIL